MAGRLYDFTNINLETAQILFSKYNEPIKVYDIKPIHNGMSTSNYIVFTNDKNSKYLLKIYPENNDHSDVEISAYKYASQYIHVPEIFWVDRSRTVINGTYVIIQYIDGCTLGDYLIKNNGFSKELIFNIGSMLAMLHRKEYNCMALLNADLSVKKVLLPFADQYEFYLNGFAGNHINKELSKHILDFIDRNHSMMHSIAEKNVFSHGDVSFSNILIDKNNAPWFIDFEYCIANPAYCDIGKFFRTRMPEYMTKDVYKLFSEGYNSKAKNKLSSNWLELSKLSDISYMLALINRKKIPDGWAADIEAEIENTLNIIEVK